MPGRTLRTPRRSSQSSPHAQFGASSGGTLIFPKECFSGVRATDGRIRSKGRERRRKDESDLGPASRHNFPGKIKNGERWGDVACDSYHRLARRHRADAGDEFLIQLPVLKFHGAHSELRIWPREFQRRDYYSRLADALSGSEIRPLVTLYHWDLPQVLEGAGGWPSS